MHLFESWGLTEQLKGRLVQAAPGVPVAKLLATHEVDLGFQQRSELIGATGVRVLGSMPPGTQVTTTFSGAVLSSAEEADLARRVLDALSEDSRRGVTTSHGMEPILDV
jgi:molybdate transport system substrate-binding protein